MIDNNRKLTIKRKRFCQEYCVDFNGTQAAIRSGYSERTANEQAARMLANVNIRDEIIKLVKKIEEKAGVRAEEIVRQLDEIRNFDIRNILTWKTELIKVGTDPVTGLDVFDYRPVVIIKDPDQVDGKMIGEISLSSRGTLSVKTLDKLDAIDKLMKHIGGYEKDNAQQKSDLHIHIEQADRRAEELANKVLGIKNNNESEK